MGNLEQLIETIDVIKFADIMDALDKNSPNRSNNKITYEEFLEKSSKIVSNYLTEIIKNI